MDTGAFDDGRYWITEVHYAKAGPDDLLMQISVTNAGPEQATPARWPWRSTWTAQTGRTGPQTAPCCLTTTSWCW